jgi:flagella basal body P-ring formation protein FlgA
MTALALLLAAATARPDCLAAETDQITAGLLAAAVPGLHSVDPGAVFGYAPAPGLIRWMRASEIRAFAGRHGADAAGATDLCVERASKIYSAAEVESALRAALDEAGLSGDGVTLSLLDYCRLPMPPGRLSFAVREIGRPSAARPEGPVNWRGRVIYQSGRGAPFWAGVRLTVRRQVVVAARALVPGRPIAAEDLKELERAAHPLDALDQPRREAIVGRAVRRPLAEGTVIEASMLQEAIQVQSGDDVEVLIDSGSAHLKVTAKALTAGRAGDVILLENTASKKRFRASVTAAGLATAEPEGADSLAASTRNQSARRAAQTAAGRVE